MAEIFNNLARSTLAAGIAAIDTVLTVQAGDGNLLFPSPGVGEFFRLVLFKKLTGDVEVITCTARTADTFTITRATEDIGNVTATAFAFNAGDLVELRPTKGFYESLSVTSTNIQNGTFLYGVDTGVADAYVVAMTPTALSLVDGQEVRVKIGSGNTNTGGAATLKLDGLPAANILMENGGNPPIASIRADFTHTFLYSGTTFVFQSTGLALTSLGHNALGRPIKNVAAGTDATDVATIGGTETLTNKTLTSPDVTTQAAGNNTTKAASTAFVQGEKGIFVNNTGGGPYVSSTSFDVVSAVTEGLFEDVGPTGSGATNIWVALNNVPGNANWIEIKVYLVGADSLIASSNRTLGIFARDSGSSAPINVPLTSIANISAFADSASQANVSTVSIAKVPVTNGVFEITYSGNFLTEIAEILLTGYGI